ARIEERNYVLYGDEKAYQSLLTLIEQMDAEAVRIRAEQDNDTDRTNADRFIELLRHYATDLHSYKDANQIKLTQTQSMIESAQATEDAARAALELQMTDRGKATDKAIQGILITLAAAIALGILISILIARSIVRPISKIKDEVARLSSGDLSTSFDTSGNDEIAELGQDLNQMTGNLRQLISEIGAASTQLSSAAEEMNAISQQNHKSVQRQQSEVSMVAAAMTEMSSTVHEVSRNAQETDQS